MPRWPVVRVWRDADGDPEISYDPPGEFPDEETYIPVSALLEEKATETVAQALFLDAPHRRKTPLSQLPAQWWEQVRPGVRRDYVREARLAVKAAIAAVSKEEGQDD